MGSTWGIQSVNMTCTRLTFILAVLIAPACSTSVGFAIKKRWSAAGCSGTDTLIYDKIQTGKGPPTDLATRKLEIRLLLMRRPRVLLTLLPTGTLMEIIPTLVAPHSSLGKLSQLNRRTNASRTLDQSLNTSSGSAELQAQLWGVCITGNTTLQAVPTQIAPVLVTLLSTFAKRTLRTAPGKILRST